jgi:superfamily II DNA or RNA helicase/HKD family nuclease
MKQKVPPQSGTFCLLGNAINFPLFKLLRVKLMATEEGKQNLTDLKFFTNEADVTLYDRFVKVLKDVRYFDVLVGYFRTSGFRRLYESLQTVERARFLVGLTLDKQAFELLETGRLESNYLETSRQSDLFSSYAQTKDDFQNALVSELDYSDNTHEMEQAARAFVEFVKSGKLELRAHPSKNIHAKVYISRFKEGDRDLGQVITGSSNFSENGLVAQREFNVELKDPADVRFALQKFEELWAEGVDVSEAYVDTLQTKTWLNDSITPYQLYLKFLYEYFKEDLNTDAETDIYLPDGFMGLAYQTQAVTAAKKILESYGGVFLADVVGLGKTFISAMLLQQLPGRKLIICPPVLQSYWRETLLEFGVPARVESLGKLEDLVADGTDTYKIILIDEAHRFRNEATQQYELLKTICAAKKVILVSATPLNNRLDDLFSLIKLFQPARKSTIPGVANLEKFFGGLKKQLSEFEKDDLEYSRAIAETSAQVRSKVLNHLMVRRTRSEIKNYFSEDLIQQGLSFPELAAPQRIIYEFDEGTGQVFNDTIDMLKSFKYARYAPLLFLKQDVNQLIAQSQKNVRGFMKGVLVKRLESSFYAFKRTVRRFIESYEKFLEMFKAGTVYISNQLDIYDLLGREDDELLYLIAEGKVQAYDAAAFEDNFDNSLYQDLIILQQIEKLWQRVSRDPKLEQFTKDLGTHPLLQNKKMVIFSESKETGGYLQESLERVFPEQTLFYSSGGGTYKNTMHSVPMARDLIKTNFDPNSRTQKDDIRYLITTDVLAEGVNLHRANIVVNYDLPWNPTRVLQRVGRVNRVGTKHAQVYVFNFFPTSRSDEHLGLEANIKAKLQAFHDTLGEDGKYLSDDEEVTTHGLFGDRLYSKLSSNESLEQVDLERSELAYLKLLREVRDKNPDLFEKIKRLPKKSRSSRAYGKQDSLVTFFRRGRLKKFYLSEGLSQELDFFAAVDRLECQPETPRQNIPPRYYELLAQNDRAFRETLEEDAPDAAPRKGGASHENKLITVLKSKELRNFKGFSDDEEDFVKAVRVALEAGSIAKATIRNIISDLSQESYEPLKVLLALRRRVTAAMLQTDGQKQEVVPREVILSAYLVGEK